MVDGDARSRVLLLLDQGLSVPSAAARAGVSVVRAQGWARELGMLGRRTIVTDELARRVREGYAASGTIKGAAEAAGLSQGAARRVLVDVGLVPTEPWRGKTIERERFLALVEQGCGVNDAARQVGISSRAAHYWRAGRPSAARATETLTTQLPAEPAAEPAAEPVAELPGEDGAGGRLLTLPDRLAIADGLLVGWTMRRIAASLGRSTSTVTREVASYATDGTYLPYQADRAAAAARARPKVSKLALDGPLRSQVQSGLQRKLSPEQISHRLRVDHPDDESMRVSTETIYQALYFQARGGLKKEVQTALRTGRTRRKPHKDPQQRTQRFTDPMVMISDRPAAVEDRAVPGHWEGDLIMGQGNRTAIGTLVERATRYTLLVHLPNGHTAEQVRDGLIATMRTLPEHLRGSLTWDQGSEMARHLQFKIATDIAVYFCDPASPWQRGTNENTNGLLRQYFDKGSDLSRFSATDLEYVAHELNGRPRKTLDWATPAERLRDLLST